MMISKQEKIPIFFIVNPNSGVGRKDTIEHHLEKKLDFDKFEPKVVFTEYPQHATLLSREGWEQGFRVIVAIGGDGTVNEAARPLIGTEAVLGIIPAGSGNGLARHLHLPTDIDKAIRIINITNVKKIDTVEINDQVFLSIAGVGFDAHVADHFARQSQRGFFGYAKVAIREYFRYRPMKFRLVVDGKKMVRRALFISFANSDQFGYNTSIAPDATVDDGMIDVVIARKSSLWKMIFFAPFLFTRKIHKTPYVEIIRAREVDIMQKVKIINLDGEPVDVGKRLHIHVIPASLNIIVP